MNKAFYPIVYRRRDGSYDMLASQTKRVAECRLRMLQTNGDVVKVGILAKGQYRYFETLLGLAREGW